MGNVSLLLPPITAAGNLLCLQGETEYKLFNCQSRAHLKDLGPNIPLIYTSVNLGKFHLSYCTTRCGISPQISLFVGVLFIFIHCVYTHIQSSNFCQQ